MKYHIKGEGDGWVTDHAVTAGVFKSFLLVGLLHIANVPKGWEDRANSIITEDDNRLNSIPGNTCRVWLLSALERLRDAGVLHCSNLVALEREVKDWGNSHQISAIDAQTPRPCGVFRTSAGRCKMGFARTMQGIWVRYGLNYQITLFRQKAKD